MKRIVKFRGKSKRTGEWLYGDLVRNVEGAFAIVPPFEMSLHNCCENYEVDKQTIGQFIGMTDKNENEIYDGDIIKTDDGLDISGYYKVSYDIDTTGFVCVGKDVHCHPGIIEEFSDIVVVGNIYDNEELLTQQFLKCIIERKDNIVDLGEVWHTLDLKSKPDVDIAYLDIVATVNNEILREVTTLNSLYNWLRYNSVVEGQVKWAFWRDLLSKGGNKQ